MEFKRTRNERRSKFRFDIERDLRYKIAEDGVVVASGSGQTINIGSGGISFRTDQPLAPGLCVELSISWPVLLDQTCPMRLIVFGRVLRCNGRKSVCSIERYEFRTQARTFQPSERNRPDSILQRFAVGVRKETLRTTMAGA
jgi:hypothetical protein